jgi:hypothetical protein
MEELPAMKDDVKIAPNRHSAKVKITMRDSCPFALLIKSTSPARALIFGINHCFFKI